MTSPELLGSVSQCVDILHVSSDEIAPGRKYRSAVSHRMRLFPRREREPVLIEDGVAYYASRSTLRAARQAERIDRRLSKLHRHRPLAPRKHPRQEHAREIKDTIVFRKDVKELRGDGLDLISLEDAIERLAEGGELPPEYDDHGLKEPPQMHRVCRIGGGFYLVYSPDDGKVILRRIWTEDVVEQERTEAPGDASRSACQDTRNPAL